MVLEHPPYQKQYRFSLIKAPILIVRSIHFKGTLNGLAQSSPYTSVTTFLLNSNFTPPLPSLSLRRRRKTRRHSPPFATLLHAISSSSSRNRYYFLEENESNAKDSLCSSTISLNHTSIVLSSPAVVRDLRNWCFVATIVFRASKDPNFGRQSFQQKPKHGVDNIFS